MTTWRTRLLLVGCMAVGLVVVIAAQSAAGSGVIAARVLESGTNAPVPDARVMLMPATRPTPGQIPQTREATSGADGTFRFDDLQPGSYRLSVQKAGFVGLSPDVAPQLIVIKAEGAEVTGLQIVVKGTQP